MKPTYKELENELQGVKNTLAWEGRRVAHLARELKMARDQRDELLADEGIDPPVRPFGE